MKSLIALLIAVSGTSAFAKSVVLSCQTKAYSCTHGLHPTCAWAATGPVVDNTIKLVQDKNYPSTAFPYEVWRASYNAFYDGHNLAMSIMYTTQDQLHPLSVNAGLATRDVAAETSGIDRIDISLHDGDYGRGFFCPSLRYEP